MTSYMCNIDAERYPDLLCTKIRHIVSKHLFQFYSLGTLVLLHDTQNPWNLLEIYIIRMLPASVAQLDALSNWKPGGRGFNPRRGRQHSFVGLIMKYFLRSFSRLCWFKKGICQFLAKECVQYWLTA